CLLFLGRLYFLLRTRGRAYALSRPRRIFVEMFSERSPPRAYPTTRRTPLTTQPTGLEISAPPMLPTITANIVVDALTVSVPHVDWISSRNLLVSRPDSTDA